MRQIYWANALFTEADRRFNAYYVKRLREAGYDVFLPQEAAVNEDNSADS
jgi:nucleoside 2-deoxyribosyltransferase